MTLFSGEFSAKPFEDSRALALFNACDKVEMHRLARMLPKRTELIDRDDIAPLDSSYFVSLRSGYLSLRQDNRRIVQPYSPHRFSRQFGYIQDVPGNIKKDIRTGSFVCTHTYWDCCTRSGTKSVVILPNQDNLKDFTVTRDYVTWWSKVYRLGPTQVTNAVIENGPRHQSSKPKEK